jgi:hypothetical protein
MRLRRGGIKFVSFVALFSVLILYFYNLYTSTSQQSLDDELIIDREDKSEENFNNILPTSTVSVSTTAHKKVTSDIKKNKTKKISISVEKPLRKK